MRPPLCACLALAAALAAHAQAPTPAQVFAEATALCQKDAGALWGHSLCGPILLFDPQSRTVTASEADKEGQLAQHDGVWTGRLPNAVNAANTAMTWAGVHWTTLVLPLPTEPHDRARLLAHELFHRIQGEIGVPMKDPPNAHLDSLEGRYWLRLEMRALALALRSPEARTFALQDALSFRAARRKLFANAQEQETALELNEGLAEYTGFRLDGSTPEERNALVASRLDENRPSYVRSFAYQSGPAYGLLLDALEPDWRKSYSRTDIVIPPIPPGPIGLSERFVQRTPTPGVTGIKGVKGVKDLADVNAFAYGGQSIRREEQARAKQIAERRAQYRAQLVDGPTLTFRHGKKMNISFNPSNLMPLDEFGTVYPTLRLSDEWGVLEVSGGALLAADWSHTTVAAPKQVATGAKIDGPGWTLTLNDGWRLAPAARPGDWTVQRAE